MHQILLVVTLLIAATSAALPRIPDNFTSIETRQLLNPEGPNERRIFFRSTAECKLVFDNWHLMALNDGDDYCWFTEYCQVDPQTGYTGLPYIYVSAPAGMHRCGIEAPVETDKLRWVGIFRSGFTHTTMGTDQNCIQAAVDTGYFYASYWGGEDCYRGHHCAMCEVDHGIKTMGFRFDESPY